MKKKINFPIKYAAMPIYDNNVIKGYVTCKCYLIKDIKTYKENGMEEQSYDVVFCKDLNQLNQEQIPKFNLYGICINVTTVTNIYDNFDMAFENTKQLNQKLRSYLINHYSYSNLLMAINNLEKRFKNYDELGYLFEKENDSDDINSLIQEYSTKLWCY